MRADPTESVTLDQKVAHLGRPDNYGGGTRAVETIETHMSYVFLTETCAYKLKKPVRDAYRDLATLEARRLNCEEEVRLNRRLAPAVYLGVVALTRERAGLTLEGAGEPVEWLVKMRRLPRYLMLDTAIRERRLAAHDVVRCVATLCAFYRAAEPVPLSPRDYRERFRRRIVDNRQALTHDHYTLDAALVARITAAQLDFVDAHAEQLGARGPMLVDGHGDLRPEHVCLSDPPVFIDCLEFDRDLRIVDPADEVGYLAMECAFMGAPGIGGHVLSAYGVASGERVDDALTRFYQSCRAVTRAKLASWHLDDAVVNGGRRKWTAQAHAYLELAGALLFSPAGAPGSNPLRACA